MAEVAILGGMLIAGYITVRMAEDDEEEENLRARAAAAAARRAGLGAVTVDVHQAEGLADESYTGVQDVRCQVEVVEAATGRVFGRGLTAVAHDGGCDPRWGDAGRGLVRVAVPPYAGAAGLRVRIALTSQSYVTSHAPLGRAECDLDETVTAFGSVRALPVDPRGMLTATLSYAPPDPRRAITAPCRPAEGLTAEARFSSEGEEAFGELPEAGNPFADDDDPFAVELQDMSGRPVPADPELEATPVVVAVPAEPAQRAADWG
mmetsp:Transcript_14195/g.42313  ORF Transcript_14195/g.42313 Transcript_14195/m.42313 type:complete len:263 (-) Transcript_14195:23-811(-)